MNELRSKILLFDKSQGRAIDIEVAIERSCACRFVYAQNNKEANQMVVESFRYHEHFVVAIITVRSGDRDGFQFARRLKNIIPAVKVVIITDNYALVEKSKCESLVDTVIITTGSLQEDHINEAEKQTLIKAVKRFIEFNKVLPIDIVSNHWRFTEHLGRIDSLRYTASVYTGGMSDESQVDKITSISVDDRRVNCVAYSKNNEKVIIAPQTTVGCTIKCRFCINWHNHKDKAGRNVCFARSLSSSEIMAQMYLAAEKSGAVRESFTNKSATAMVVNFAGAGDGLVNNLDNCVRVIRQMSKIRKPEISFIITSVGSPESLQEYLDKYIDLPRVTHYWSVNSLDQKTRDWLMPGTAGQSITQMCNLYEEIAHKSGRPVTASFALFKGKNDSDSDVEKIAAFVKGRPFRVKIMAGCPGSLAGVPDISIEEARDFTDKLKKAGVKDVRFREIYGSATYSGCGNTKESFGNYIKEK